MPLQIFSQYLLPFILYAYSLTIYFLYIFCFFYFFCFFFFLWLHSTQAVDNWHAVKCLLLVKFVQVFRLRFNSILCILWCLVSDKYNVWQLSISHKELQFIGLFLFLFSYMSVYNFLLKLFWFKFDAFVEKLNSFLTCSSD